MSANYKKRIQSALNNYLHKNAAFPKPTKLKEDKPKKVRNKKPEYDTVQLPCLMWLRSLGFSSHTYDSKAVWDNRAQCYVTKGLPTGHSDIHATSSPHGYALYIECKSPGKRSTLRDAQRAFIASKIDCGAFAVVVDSLELLQANWAKWSALRAEGKMREASDYLFQVLPKAKYQEFKMD